MTTTFSGRAAEVLHPLVLARLVYEPSGCLTWDGALDRGYGKANLGGWTLRIHRHVYEALMGLVPPGLDLDHLCRNRACANPHHLEPVTRAENLRRGVGGFKPKTLQESA